MSSRAHGLAGAALLALLLTFLCWRAASPVSRNQGGMDYTRLETDGRDVYLPRNANGYENVVTQVTAYNFAHDGFWRTHLLPNRGRAPSVSLYDFTGTQCATLSTLPEPIWYRNIFGQSRPMQSLNGDCIYTHYPPLADWVFGSMARLGLDRVLHYKLLAIGLNVGLCYLLYRWLRREVQPTAALVACALLASCPAFLQWADTLYYHCLQFQFLIAGVLAWTRHLERKHAIWLPICWLFYFCEALASFQLTICFGVVLLGLQALDARPRTKLERFVPLAVQALAPIAAFSLHFSLSASLFGWHAAFDNLKQTFRERVGAGYPHGVRALIQASSEGLVPWSLLLLGVALVVVMASLSRTSPRRPLALLAIFGLGGASFAVAFPGTTSWHTWMMYRHFIPVAALLFAFLADGSLRCWPELRGKSPSPRARRALAAGCLLVVAALLGRLALRNASELLGEIALQRAKARAYDPANLVRRSLDVVYWSEGQSAPEGILYLPVAGLLQREPRAWNTDFRLRGPAPAHYEIWWLEPVAIKTVRVLVDESQTSTVEQRCSVHFFDDIGFAASPAITVHSAALVAPGDCDLRAEAYVWVSFSLSAQRTTRAARLTCSDFDRLALRQIEVFAT